MANNPKELSEQISQKNPKTVGEDLLDFYNDAFYKSSQGDIYDFVNRNINRFGIPKGSNRKKEVEYYSKVFNDMAKTRNPEYLNNDVAALEQEFNTKYNKEGKIRDDFNPFKSGYINARGNWQKFIDDYGMDVINPDYRDIIDWFKSHKGGW